MLSGTSRLTRKSFALLIGRSWLRDELVYRFNFGLCPTVFCLFSVWVEVRSELFAIGWLVFGLLKVIVWFCRLFLTLLISLSCIVTLQFWTLVVLRVSFYSCYELSLIDVASMLCYARIDPCGRVEVRRSWLTESSRLTFRNFSGAVALKISLSALFDCILLAPDDLGRATLVRLIILLLFTLYWVCSNLLSVLLLNWAKN